MTNHASEVPLQNFHFLYDLDFAILSIYGFKNGYKRTIPLLILPPHAIIMLTHNYRCDIVLSSDGKGPLGCCIQLITPLGNCYEYIVIV